MGHPGWLVRRAAAELDLQLTQVGRRIVMPLDHVQHIISRVASPLTDADLQADRWEVTEAEIGIVGRLSEHVLQ